MKKNKLNKDLKISREMEWRRFEIIDKKNEDKLLKLLDDKNLSREDLLLILNTIKI
ncbi:hypothetical protein [uncultured Clostridium sp.]|uniref:hypothetical protein n=1 Tax=uncultured Clostridium sp. TaxID=59620 RepID=UPI0027307C21|nr:hypothetical protein [uncultured Clostridium sp.]